MNSESYKTNGNILVIDDNQENLLLLTTVLKDRGHQVRASKSGKEGLASVYSKLPDLILLDIKLPDLSGYEVCKILKADHPTKDIPVIFLSVLNATDDKLKAFEAGGIDYITKPFIPEEVLIRVQTHLEIGRLRTQMFKQASELHSKNIQLQTEATDRNRTSERLHESFAKLEDSKVAALNILEDLKLEITQRKQAEELLRETNEYLQNLINHANAPIIVWDHEFNITRFNKAFEYLSGYEASEVKGKKVDLLFPKEKVESSHELMNKTAYGARWETVEIEILRKDGEIRVVLWNSAYILDQSETNIVATIAQGNDITERKISEELLSKSEAMLQTVLDNFPGVVFWKDRHSNYLGCNHEFSTGAGLNNPTEIVGKNDFDLPWARTEAENYRTDDAQVMESGQAKLHIVEMQHRLEGQVNWLDTSKIPMHDPDGNVIGVIGVSSDVTDRKLAEESLMKSENKFRTMVETIPLAIHLTTGLEQVSEYINPKMVELFGYTIEDIPTVAQWWPLAYPDDSYRKKVSEEWNDKVRLAIEKQSSIEPMEVLVNCKDGSKKYVSWGYITHGEKNYSFGLDLTARKKAEDDLRKHSMRLQNLHMIDQAILQAIESPESVVQTAIQHVRDLLQCQRASVGILDLEKKAIQVYAADVEGNSIIQTGKILTEEVYGIFDILRSNKMEIVEDLSNPASASVLNTILQHEGVQASVNVALVSALEIYGVLNVGWEKARNITLEEIEIVGEVANQITIAIEKARLLQETKGYAAELEKRVEDRTAQLLVVNKELEAFSYSVSHDLRAPLRHISGFADMLANDSKAQLPEKSLHYLDVINNSARKMGTLIDDLLSFSRTGRTEMRKSNFKMNNLVEEVLGQEKISNPDRTIRWNIANLPLVFGDYNLLRQVWANYIENAIKYTRTRETAEIRIDFAAEKEEYIFSISDNGVGFDMQYATKLFGVFQRLHSSDEFEGTGIGLANMQRIVTRHGGRTWAEAKLNMGATFYFTLPK